MAGTRWACRGSQAPYSHTNEEPSRRRLHSVERKLKRNEELKIEYDNIVNEQIEQSIVEKAPEQPTGERVHKPVVRESAISTKVRMVFDASAKPHPLANSVNECMHTSPPLQPLLWDIMIRARMSSNILLADLQKAFLQIAIKEEDRDAFCFLFNINGKEEHLRFTRVPFGAEASPFMLGGYPSASFQWATTRVRGYRPSAKRKHLRGQSHENRKWRGGTKGVQTGSN